MARQTGITINGTHFQTKALAKKYISDILKMYEIGQRVDFYHEVFLRELLKKHWDYEMKAGQGIAYIFTKRAEPYWSKGFCIKRVDGSEEMFSYTECLAKTPQSTRVRLAMRRAVMESIHAYKREAFTEGMTCPITGEFLQIDTCHVDHEPPMTFAKIAEDFIAHDGLDIDTVEINNSEGVNGDKFHDTALEARFLAYHDSVARLRLLSKNGNMEVAKMVRSNQTHTPTVN
jgi:hypothetical protein